MLEASLTGLIFSSNTQKTRYTMTAERLIQNRFLKASAVLKSRNEYCYVPVMRKYNQQKNP